MAKKSLKPREIQRHKVVMNYLPKGGWVIQFCDPIFSSGYLEVALWALSKPDLELVGIKVEGRSDLPKPKSSKAKFDGELSEKYVKKAKLKECFNNCFKVLLGFHEFPNTAQSMFDENG